jgi:hypothetical protein
MTSSFLIKIGVGKKFQGKFLDMRFWAENGVGN